MNERSIGWVAACVIFCVFAMTPVVALAQDEPAPPTQYVAPQLNVPIPGLDFADYPIIKEGSKIKVPYLAAYISAAYRYIVSITVIVASIAFIYGAFLYLIGSALDKIQSGKQIMTDAVIGMLLVLGSYTILRLVNPALLFPQTLDVYSVTERPFNVADLALTNATEDTITPAVFGNVSALPPDLPTDIVLPTGGPYQQGVCPIILPPGAGLIEYYRLILPFISAPTVTDRIFQSMDISVSCHQKFPSCGRAVSTSWALAGVGSQECLFDKKKSCNLSRMEQEHAIQTVFYFNPTELRGLHCNADCPEELKNYLCGTNLEDFFTKSGSVQVATNIMRTNVPAEKNWPDGVAELMHPGDIVWIYNANNDCSGLHAFIFVEWENEKKGIAKVFQGANGKQVRYDSLCIKRACAGSRMMMPVTQVVRPK